MREPGRKTERHGRKTYVPAEGEAPVDPTRCRARVGHWQCCKRAVHRIWCERHATEDERAASILSTMTVEQLCAELARRGVKSVAGPEAEARGREAPR